MIHGADTFRIPVILCIDVEPDEFFIDRSNPKPWAGFEFTHDYLKELRFRFEESTGHSVHFNWMLRMDPQVATAYGSSTWVTDRYAAFFEEYRSMGDGIGLHVHTIRWSDSRDGWVDDCGNPDWVMECLESSVDSFKRVFGEPGRILRFGNRWLSTLAINRAEELGIEYDLTVEPGLRSIWGSNKTPAQSGPTPNYYRVPRVPYSPSRSDFRMQSNDINGRDITILPLSSAYTKRGWGLKALRRSLRRLRRNGVHGRLQSLPLSMWRKWDGQNSYAAMLERSISLQKRPYLAFAIRSDLNGNEFQEYDACLKTLLGHAAGSRFMFCTPHEAMDQLMPI